MKKSQAEDYNSVIEKFVNCVPPISPTDGDFEDGYNQACRDMQKNINKVVEEYGDI